MPGIEKETCCSVKETAQTTNTETQNNSSSSNTQVLSPSREDEPQGQEQQQQQQEPPTDDNLLIQQDQINNGEEGREMSQTDRINRQLLKSFLDRMNTENFDFDKTNDNEDEEQNFDD